MSTITDTLESIRAALRAENVSIGELIELESLAAFIDVDDVELLEPACVPEFGPFTYWVEHEDCEGDWDTAFPPEARDAWFRYYRAQITGQPIWECKRCGDKFLLVDCACHVAHVCDNS